MNKEPEIEPLDGETILQTIEDCADRIMASLEVNDCDETVFLALKRDVGVIDLKINHEIYTLENGEWTKTGKRGQLK